MIPMAQPSPSWLGPGSVRRAVQRVVYSERAAARARALNAHSNVTRASRLGQQVGAGRYSRPARPRFCCGRCGAGRAVPQPTFTTRARPGL
jgi:hypothetical protein